MLLYIQCRESVCHIHFFSGKSSPTTGNLRIWSWSVEFQRRLPVLHSGKRIGVWCSLIRGFLRSYFLSRSSVYDCWCKLSISWYTSFPVDALLRRQAFRLRRDVWQEVIDISRRFEATTEASGRPRVISARIFSYPTETRSSYVAVRRMRKAFVW